MTSEGGPFFFTKYGAGAALLPRGTLVLPAHTMKTLSTAIAGMVCLALGSGLIGTYGFLCRAVVARIWQ